MGNTARAIDSHPEKNQCLALQSRSWMLLLGPTLCWSSIDSFSCSRTTSTQVVPVVPPRKVGTPLLLLTPCGPRCAPCPRQPAASAVPLPAPRAEQPAAVPGPPLPQGGQGLAQPQGMPCACQGTGAGAPSARPPPPFSNSALGEDQRTSRSTALLPTWQWWRRGCEMAAHPTWPRVPLPQRQWEAVARDAYLEPQTSTGDLE